jgi:hypothetical protein
VGSLIRSNYTPGYKFRPRFEELILIVYKTLSLMTGLIRRQFGTGLAADYVLGGDKGTDAEWTSSKCIEGTSGVAVWLYPDKR